MKALPLSFFVAPDAEGGKENVPPVESETGGKGFKGCEEREEEEELGRAVARQRRRQLERALCWEAASDPLVPGGGCIA